MKYAGIFVLALLFGCVSPTPLPDLQEIRTPVLNQETTAELGDTMVRYVIAAIRPSWQLQSPFKELPPGYILTPFASDAKYESFREKALCRSKATGEWCHGQSGFGDCNAFTCSMGSTSVTAKRADWVDTSTRNVDQQLIYNGRIKNSVKFTYREFTASGIARDAFSQDVQYDLEEGRIIGFKGARIEILEATNRKIIYRVLNHFPMF